MPKHCVLNFNNPVTGLVHSSLVGYMMNQYGLDVDTVQSVLDAGFMYSKKDGIRSWASNKSTSDYAEPSILEILKSQNIEVNPNAAQYLDTVQKFYDSNNLSITVPVNLTEANKLFRQAMKQNIVLELEAVNPEAPIRERMYNILPNTPGRVNAAMMTEGLFTEIDEAGYGPKILKHITPYINLENPDIYDTAHKIMMDDSTPDYMKTILRKFIVAAELNPDMVLVLNKKINQEENVDLAADTFYAGVFKAKTNTIELNMSQFPTTTVDSFKHIFVHELGHGILSSTLSNPQTKYEKQFVNEATRIFNYYRSKYESEGSVGKYYGLSDVHEFVSEFISNSEFRGILQEESPEEYTSLWDSIKNFFRNLFRLTPTKGTRVDIAYIDSILNEFLDQVLYNQNLNTSTLYVTNEDYAYTIEDTKVQDFLSKLPGNSSEFLTRLDEFLNSDVVDWKAVYQHSLKTGISVSRLDKAEEILGNLTTVDITKSDIIESFKGIVTHLHETALYLQMMTKSLQELSQDKTIPLNQLYLRSYHAKELGKFFEEYIKNFKSIMGEMPANTILASQLDNIETYTKKLSEVYNKNASTAIADRLSQEIAPQLAKISGTVQQEISRLERLLEQQTKDGNLRLAEITKKKLDKEKEFYKNTATKDGIKRALEGELGKDTSHWSLWLESAAINGNLVTGSFGSLVSNLYDEANAEAMILEQRMKVLADRLQQHLGSKGTSATTALDFQKVFGPFIRKVKIKQLKRGEIIERDALVFQTEFDEVAYQNDKIEYLKKIQDIQTKKNKTAQDEQDLENAIKALADFEATYEESYYTEEFENIQNLLIPAAKEARDEIIEQMRALQISPTQGDQTEEDLDALDNLKVKLDQLESYYDEYGIPKDQQGIEIAESIRAWKQARNDEKLYSYKLTPENKELFNSIYDSKKQAVIDAEAELVSANTSGNQNDIAVATAKLNRAKSSLDIFKKNNVVKKISSEFYENRRLIQDSINTILANYPEEFEGRSITEIYDELFSMLKAYKNKNGEYEGSKIVDKKTQIVVNGVTQLVNIPLRVKELEDELADVRSQINENRNLSSQDKAQLKNLFETLSSMQKKETTQDYKEAYSKNYNRIRTRVLAQRASEGKAALDEKALAREVVRQLEKDTWYQDNHRKVNKGRKGMVYEPTFQWQVTLPTNPAYISESDPSFRWYNIEINPSFINQNVKNGRMSKRPVLKRSNSRYANPEYNRLDGTEKQILNEVLTIYKELDAGMPKNLRRGIELPTVLKSGLESLGNAKFGNIWAQTKGTLGVIKDTWTFEREDEELATDKPSFGGGSQINRYNRRLYLRYSTPPSDIDKVSVNFFNTVTQYGADVIRFKKAFNNLAYIYGTRDIVQENLAGTNTSKVINNMIERRFNGQGRKTLFNNKALKAVEYGVGAALGLGANLALSVNLPSSIKNFLAGSYNIYTQAAIYGISRKDISVAMYKNKKHYYQLFRSYVEDGVDSPYVAKMRYFNVMPEDHLSETGRNVYTSKFRKIRKTYNPLGHMAFLRTFGEFEMRSAVSEALSNKYLVELNNGKVVPIFDAFVVDNNKVVPRSDIKNLEGFDAVVQQFRGELNAINSYIHGAYGAIDKGEYSRYTIGRYLMYMKGWFAYQTVRRVGSRKANLRAGIDTQGFYRTFAQYVGLALSTRSFGEAENLLSSREKAERNAAMYDTLGVAVVMLLGKLLSAAVYDDDDEEYNNPLTYFALYNLLYLEDELNSLHPVFGPAAIYYSRFVNNVEGKDFLDYYYERTFKLPLRGSYDLISTAIQFANPFDDLDMFNEYVPLSRTGKPLNPKRYKPDPYLQGQTELSARLQKLWALDKSVNYLFGNSEYIYRKYEHMNPRYYINSFESDLRAEKRTQNSAKKQIKSLKTLLNDVYDDDTREDILNKIEKLKTESNEAKQNQRDLESSVDRF